MTHTPPGLAFASCNEMAEGEGFGLPTRLDST